MILGIGNDLIDIRRIKRSLERFGERFEQRVFTPIELEKAARRKGGVNNSYAGTLAKRFAAKEACAKALGTGFSQGVFLRDIAVVNLPTGQPTLQLHGGAAEALRRKLCKGLDPTISLTMTDEYPMAEAMVVISAVPSALY